MQDQQRVQLATALGQAEFVLLSDTNPARLRRLSNTFPVETTFYTNLLQGRSGFEIVQVFRNVPALFGITVDDRRAELTLRLFDHPTIYILRRATPNRHTPIPGDDTRAI